MRARLARFNAPWQTPQVSEVLEPLIATHRATHPKADTRLLQRAYDAANHWHTGQFRKSGDPYITHPLAVATILANLGMDTTTLVAALLHDTIEDTEYTLDQMRDDFGAEVALLVDGVTKLDRVKLGDAAKAETIRKMVVAMAKDPRVLVIKLADRLHNMRTLAFLPQPKREQKARETLEILAPLAHRLGMNTIKWELEDLAFGALYPKRHEEINRLVGEHAPQRDSLLGQVTQKVGVDLKSAKIKAEVTGRPKHLYSIYQKMIARGRDFGEIYDLVGVRVLVDTVRDCYAALGIIHANWQPVPGRFKDYIAMPKFNMYQSLHTTVIGPNGKPVEMQIRTYAMHRTAEYGIAAHWRYKETKNATIVGPPAHIDEMTWLRQLLDWQREAADPTEFLDALRFDLSAARGVRLHAQGRRHRAAQGLDAGRLRLRRAHRGRPQVHRREGQRQARAAGEPTVQRRRHRDLHLEVRDGEPVAGLARLRAEPARPYEDPPVLQQGAPRGRDRAGQGRHRQGDAQAGPAAAADAHLRLADDDRPRAPPARRRRRCTRRSARTRSRPSRWWPSSSPASAGSRGPPRISPRPRYRPAGRAPRPTPHDPGVVVRGVSDIWVKLARCCTPVPGDPIFGFITRTGGVSVHREDCTNADELRQQADRVVTVEWKPTAASMFLVADPGRGAGPAQAARRRDPGALRRAGQHPVGHRHHDPRPGRGQPVHLRDGRPQAPRPPAGRGAQGGRRLRRLPRHLRRLSSRTIIASARHLHRSWTRVQVTLACGDLVCYGVGVAAGVVAAGVVGAGAAGYHRGRRVGDRAGRHLGEGDRHVRVAAAGLRPRTRRRRRRRRPA